MNIKSPEQIGRRQVALERFGDAWRKSRESSRSLKDQVEGLLPRIGLLADGDSIQNQQIDVISEGERVVVTFKLAKEQWRELTKKLHKDPTVTKEPIIYDGTRLSHVLCDGLKLTMENFNIHVAELVGNNILSSHGLVRIEIGEKRSVVERDNPENDDYSFSLASNLHNFPTAPTDKSSEEFWQAGMQVNHKEHGIRIDSTSNVWPPVAFQTNSNLSGVTGEQRYSNLLGMDSLLDVFEDKIVVGVRSRVEGQIYYLELSDPKIQEVLGMRDYKVATTRETLVDESGNSFEIVKGINYFLADLTATYIDPNYNEYKVSGYVWDDKVGPSIVLQGKDLKILSFKQFLQLKLTSQKKESKLKTLNERQLAEELEEVLEKLVGVKDALLTPDEKAERAYKLNRYRWVNKVPKERKFTDTEEKAIISSVERKEVAPGYFTFIENGRAKRMNEAAPFFLFHVCDPENIPKMVKSNSLICSHERFRRGLKVDGMSSGDDLMLGGGDGVFLRMWADKNIVDRDLYYHKVEDATLVFDNSILDRTDYYCYSTDKCGAITPDEFPTRITTEELLALQVTHGYQRNNELIFRHGISFKDVKFIAVKHETQKIKLLEMFRKAEIKEVNGKPVEDFVVDQYKYFDVATTLYGYNSFLDKQKSTTEGAMQLLNMQKKSMIGSGQAVTVLKNIQEEGDIKISMRRVVVKDVSDDFIVTKGGHPPEIIKLEEVILNCPAVNVGDKVRVIGDNPEYVVDKVFYDMRGGLTAIIKRVVGIMGSGSTRVSVFSLELVTKAAQSTNKKF
ncbi:MAG: hypothetical protein HY225_03925 [Candidatus Vogelbacteria bacterium]|nr:hypothetical protein [Candidatus Vogelbacteria bacterium]